MIYVIFLKNMNIRRRTELGNETRYRTDDIYRSIDLPFPPLSLLHTRQACLPRPWTPICAWSPPYSSSTRAAGMPPRWRRARRRLSWHCSCSQVACRWGEGRAEMVPGSCACNMPGWGTRPRQGYGGVSA
jgi:hypothetical protein